MARTDFYNPNLVVVISGPSGSGKSTVVKALCQADETLRLAVSATTRAPRPREVDGVDYHFLSKAEFKNQIQQDGFLEWAAYGGNFYGTLNSEIVAAQTEGKDAVLEIEVQGALQVRKQIGPDTARILLIFIVPSAFANLDERLRGRKTESEAETDAASDYSDIRNLPTLALRLLRHQPRWRATTGCGPNSGDYCSRTVPN